MTLKSLGPRLPRKQARPAPPDDDPAPQAMFSNQIELHGIANLLMTLGFGHP